MATLTWATTTTAGTPIVTPVEFGASLQTLIDNMITVLYLKTLVKNTKEPQIQPQEASPARHGLSRSPITIPTPIWVTTTTAGTLMVTPLEYGATLQTLIENMITVLYTSVLQVG